MILVTGGAGFIGSHLVHALTRKGHKVRVLDILLRGDLRHIQPHIDSGQVEFIHGDIRYSDTVDMAMHDVSTVFHLAATSINRSKVHIEESNAINLQGTILVARSFMRCGDPNDGKFIFASSASVYGEPERLPMCETDEPKPITPYCHAKHQSEVALDGFTKGFGLTCVALRYFNVYGPGQNADAHYTAVIPLFIRQLLSGDGITINGDGSQSMDLVSVHDVVQANLLAMKVPDANGIFNVGSGQSTSVIQLAGMLREQLGVHAGIIYGSAGDTLVTRRQADITKATSVLGYMPQVPLVSGLRDVINYERSKL